MSWLDYGPLLSIVVGYLLFLFGVAYWAERSRRLRHPRLQMLTYVLTASVYCTAWTFYGSVGLAANRGLEFLTIYLGPALIALLWPVLLRRLVRVAKEQRITSISDFISSRYGKSAPLGALVAGLVVRGPDPVHRAPAPGGVPVVQADPPPGDDPGALRPDPPGCRRAGALRDPVRRAQPRLHAGAAGPPLGGGGRVGGEAPRVPDRRASGSPGCCSAGSATSSAGRSPTPSSAASSRSARRRPRRSRAGRRSCSFR